MSQEVINSGYSESIFAMAYSLSPRSSTQENKYKSIGAPAFVLFFSIATIFLPFTRALTINVGFPLKIYEIFLVMAIPVFFLSRYSVQKWFVEKYLFLLLVILIVGLCSSLSLIFDTASVSEISFRGGRIADSFMRVAYLAFNIFVFCLAFFSAIKRERLIINAWLIGLLFAMSYHLYTFFSFNFTGDAFLLPGLERHQIGLVGSIPVPRSGTFEEGNFAGLYYLASFALAQHVKKRFFVGIALLGIFLTLSTSTILGLLVYLTVYIFSKNKLSFKVLSKVVIVFLIGAYLFICFDVSSKFSSRAGQSGSVRLNEAVTGLKIFNKNPIFGAGMGQYGFLFDQYEWRPENRVFSNCEKHIPNNVYVELLAEMGFVCFLVFICFWLKWTIIFLKGNLRLYEFFSFGIAVAVVFLAYPTFNITFLWCFAGMGLGIKKKFLLINKMHEAP